MWLDGERCRESAAIGVLILIRLLLPVRALIRGQHLCSSDPEVDFPSTGGKLYNVNMSKPDAVVVDDVDRLAYKFQGLDSWEANGPKLLQMSQVMTRPRSGDLSAVLYQPHWTQR